MRIFICLLLFLFSSCSSENDTPESSRDKGKSKDAEKKKLPDTRIDEYYTQNRGNDSVSISTGTYSNGKLIHGKLIPFKGKNFEYFSETSYLSERAFVNDKVLQIILNTYEELYKLYPGKMFYIMETSHKNGGRFFPHRTHQNGLSVDFMTPLLKNGKDYTGLDKMGIPHYWLEFDKNGFYLKDNTVSIHFNLVAHHILLLHKHAQKLGYKVNRVHFKNDLHDDLLATQYGKELRKQGIVLTTLTQLISRQHDDHFHVDFAK